MIMTRKILRNIVVVLCGLAFLSGCSYINQYKFKPERKSAPLKRLTLAEIVMSEPEAVSSIPESVKPKKKTNLKKRVTGKKKPVLVKTNKKVNKQEKSILSKTRDRVRISSEVCKTGTVTADQLNRHFARYKNSKLNGKGNVFISMEKKYGISARFMAAIATQESGCGTSNRARTRNDCFGMTGYGKNKRWGSIDSNIECAFSLIDRLYIKKGRTTVTSIGRVYCATGGWASHVTSHMRRI